MKFLYGDLSKVSAHAIVISANPEPICGEGVDAAIYDAVGEKRLIFLRKAVGKIGVGEAVYTKALSLQARYIIHTVAPMWRGGSNGEPELLEKCFSNSLKLAEELNCKSIAFPLIGTKSGRIPKKEAIKIALRVCGQYPDEKLDIKLVLYDVKTVETVKELYPDMEISEIVDMDGIWVPDEHNLYCEKKNILKYQDIKSLEKIARTVGDNGQRTKAISVNLPYIRTREELVREREDIGVHPAEGFNYYIIPKAIGTVLYWILLPLGYFASLADESFENVLFWKWYFILAFGGIGLFYILEFFRSILKKISGKNKKDSTDERAKAELINIKKDDIALSRLIYREFNIEKHLFETVNSYNIRVCVDYLSEISGDSNEKIINSFYTSLFNGLKDLSIQQLCMTKKLQETELQYYSRCISSLRQLYEYEDDDMFVLIAAYLKRPDLSNKMKQIVAEPQSIQFSGEWDKLGTRYRPETTKGEVYVMKQEHKRLEKVFYDLLLKYIQLHKSSISSETHMIQSDYYKARNYILAHREDWMYALTPSAFLGIPYDILYTQYKNLFSVIQLKFYAMLEAAGMLEDFQTFCDLNGEKNYDYTGRLLFHIIYYTQCERNALKERKAPLSKKLESISDKAATNLKSFSDNEDKE